MPNRIYSSVLYDLQGNLASGNAAAVYDFLRSQGYRYAGLAQGVNLDSTVSGATAIGFLGLSGQVAGRPIDDTELIAIKTELVKAYVDVLIKQAENSPDGMASRDLNSQNAWDIHNDVFRLHDLSPDVWRVSTNWASSRSS
ncbi:hypothetical protein SAMN05444172_3151 [Burkholderia sp. GAS332]|nr:hypothetical protein SAMN05444172_3151 [Burkholderia sp. GAS332]